MRRGPHGAELRSRDLAGRGRSSFTVGGKASLVASADEIMKAVVIDSISKLKAHLQPYVT